MFGSEEEPSPKFPMKEQYYGYEILHTDLTHKNKILGQLSWIHLQTQHLFW